MTRPNGVYTSLAVAPDGTRLYALDAAAGLVDIFEPASHTLVGSVILGSASWADLVLVPQRSRLYVSAGSAASLAVIDTTTSMPADDISTTSPGQGMAPSPDGARVYVAEPNQAAPAASLIEVIDTTAGTLVNTLGSVIGGERPGGLTQRDDAVCGRRGVAVPRAARRGRRIHRGGRAVRGIPRQLLWHAGSLDRRRHPLCSASRPALGPRGRHGDLRHLLVHGERSTAGGHLRRPDHARVRERTMPRRSSSAWRKPSR